MVANLRRDLLDMRQSSHLQRKLGPSPVHEEVATAEATKESENMYRRRSCVATSVVAY